MKSRCLLVNLAKYRDITGKSTNFSWFNHHGQRFGEKRSRRVRLGQRVDADVEAAMQRAKESGHGIFPGRQWNSNMGMGQYL
jgi:hypothetical protein